MQHDRVYSTILKLDVVFDHTPMLPCGYCWFLDDI